MQAVLLFGSEMWVLTLCMGRSLGSPLGWQGGLRGRHLNQWEDGGWYYPPMETAMEEAGFDEMVAYALKRNNTVAQYIATRPILDLCEETVRRPGVWVARRWWEQ